MKITMLEECLVPSMPLLLKGVTYAVSDDLAHTLIERMHAVKAEEVKEEPKEEKSTKSKK